MVCQRSARGGHREKSDLHVSRERLADAEFRPPGAILPDSLNHDVPGWPSTSPPEGASDPISSQIALGRPICVLRSVIHFLRMLASEFTMNRRKVRASNRG